MMWEIFVQKLLSESQNRGIITLMFKSGEREDIKNWKPITLLNVDNKIVSKILAERLKRVLPNIINTDQKRVGIFFRGIDYYRIS